MIGRDRYLFAVSRGLWGIAVVFGLAGEVPAVAVSDSSTVWLTGGDLAARLAEPVGGDWAGRPLREALNGLARARQVAIFLDRRVDPDQLLTVSLQDVSLEAALERLAESRGLGVSRFGSVIFLGPVRVAARLRTLAALRSAEVRRLPAEVGLRFARTQRLAWDDLAEPRVLLKHLAEENGFELLGLEQVPHDLWAAADLPPLSLVERVTLLASQFDLTFEVVAEGKQLALTPIGDKVGLVRSYPAGRQAEQLVEKWRALAPECQIERSGSRIIVEGLVEDHERLMASSRPISRTTPKLVDGPSPTNKRFTVREAQGPLNGLLDELARRLNLELKIDRQALDQAGISLQQNIRFSVEEATLDELLGAVLAPAGCTFRREGSVVEIGAREEKRKDEGVGAQNPTESKAQ